MSINDDNLTDAEIDDLVQRYAVSALKVLVTMTVWVASLALLKFGFTAIFYAWLVGLMACFATWRVQIQPLTLIVFVAAVAYAVWAR